MSGHLLPRPERALERSLHPPQVVRPEFTRPITSERLHGISVGENMHAAPKCIQDKVAYAAVKSLRVIADCLFYRRYVHRAIVLETVAAIPGMVGGLVRHLRSLRKMQEDGENIRALFAEAENERMHLMTWMKVAKPWLIERVLVVLLQGVFFNAYLSLYLASPYTAHRFVGYLEEEAIHSYTEMIRDIKRGRIQNVQAPNSAVQYWKLPQNATVLDVAYAVRADEAAHRDTNHKLADKILTEEIEDDHGIE